MRTILSTFSLVFLLSFTQVINNVKKTLAEKEYNSSKYLKEAIKFIKAVRPNLTNDTAFILADKPSNIQKQYCSNGIWKDTTILSREELDYIKHQDENPQIQKWTSKILPGVRILKRSTIEDAFKDPGEWDYFHKHIGKSFSTISAPIFLRDYSYCIFYFDNHCGGLCGHGELNLYKKVNDKWEVVMCYCVWVS